MYGSGSGSGDGGDDGPLDPENDDEDDESPDENISETGSGYPPPLNPAFVPEVPKVPLTPTLRKEDGNASPPRVDVTETTKQNKTSTTDLDSGANDRQQMSLSRAVTTYLLPIAVMWFGGCFTEWL